jgi:hypothetical protein
MTSLNNAYHIALHTCIHRYMAYYMGLITYLTILNG